MYVKARHGAFFFTFIADYLRYGYMYLSSQRYEALDVFKRFLAEAETQLDQRVKTLQTDCAREYLSQMFKHFCKQKGIRRQLTIPSTPSRMVWQSIGIGHCLTWSSQ